MEQPVRPSRSLKGRVAIVTGAGAAGDGIGNGRAAAILLAEDGATVVCVDVAKDPVTRTVEMIEKDGKGAAIAMQFALREAKLSPESVDYINAHGTSTQLGDLAETKAIKSTFGEAARKVSISSTKSHLGHLLGASGGVEAVITCMSVHHNLIPPTINLDNQDPECDLDYTPHKAKDKKVVCAMSNSFGFGGHNASLLFKKIV